MLFIVGYIKRKVGASLSYNKNYVWFDKVLPNIIKQYNRQKVKGTSYPRNAVNQHNEHHFLSQLLNTPTPTLEFNLNLANPENIPTPQNQPLFDFYVGQKVLVLRKVHPKYRNKTHAFHKASILGSFAPDVHTITRCYLKKAKNFFWVPAYSVNDIEGTLYTR